ncbi:hypothetical protein HG536_0C02240 [Torulaspora globosa]|uniref:Uncharacterized protein n=1 Tax=Torulaspora globosa TaxID=48254 RepID=A0A7G3ZEW9_9SACH|nr:uncharacterized protein HG536_0C02240 [Torulaspora globosa]QLL32055.1 hypothetical protein HG536_0C02240 [Torulaspora globosa]
MPSVVDKSVFEYGGKTLVAITPDYNTLCVASKNGLAKLLQVDKPEEEPEVLEISKNLSSVKCDPSAGYLITTVNGDAFRLDPTSASDKLLARSALPLRDGCIIHSGKTAVLGGDDLELLVIDLEEDTLKKSSIKVEEQISQMSYAPQTNLLSISFINGKVQFFSVSSTRPHRVHELAGYITANTYKSLPNDDSSAETLNASSVNIGPDSLDDAREQNIDDPEFCDENRICTRVSWHPNGFHFALPCADCTIKIFNVKGYALMKTLKDSVLPVAKFIDLQFDPLTGSYIASVDINNGLLIWNWHTSEIVYRKNFKHNITNFVWRAQADNKTLDIILGTWTGDIINIKGIVESVLAGNGDGDGKAKEQQQQHNALFVDSDLDDSEIDAPSANVDIQAEESDSEGIFTQNADEGKRRYPFENDDGFIDDDDGAGYVSHKKRHQHSPNAQLTTQVPNTTVSQYPSFRYKPVSPGATPFGRGGRRYMTMNNVGYVSVVKNNEQNSVTVSFFDIGRFREYHFEDVFGYDLCSLNEEGTLLGQSKTGMLHYRSHNMIHSNWTKMIPLTHGERITSIAATTFRIFVGSSHGYMRIFNRHGLPLAVEKVSPVVALAAQDYKVFAVHYSPYHGISYSLFELSPTASKYYQRECPLPMTLPQLNLTSEGDVDKQFIKFSPLGLKSLFFSAYGDPCLFGSDNVLLLLSKWRSPSESRWLPVLDANMELWKMSGGKNNTQIHVWPLGLNYDTLNCILVKGKNIWPEFPLPLPSEMEMRIPILVKSRIVEEEEKRKSKSEDTIGEGTSDGAGGGQQNEEIAIPPTMAAEEELLRSKVLSDLLKDSIENDGEVFGNENEILSSLNWSYDKALLRLFAGACAEQNMEMATSLVKEIKQDKALIAATKIAERAELPVLVKKINETREARFEEQINN